MYCYNTTKGQKVSNMKQMSKEIIALQHETKLIDKKIDVVGVLQSKTATNIERTTHSVKQYTDKIAQVNYDDTFKLVAQLDDKTLDIINQQKAIHQDMASVLTDVNGLKDGLVDVKESVVNALTQKEAEHTDVLTTLSDAIADSVEYINQHVDDNSLVAVEEHVNAVRETTIAMNKDNKQNIARINSVLGVIEQRIAEMDKTSEHLTTSIYEFEALLETADETLSTVDRKMCDVSPLYTAPTVDDIAASYDELASQDLDALAAQLHKKEEIVESDEPTENEPDNVDVFESPEVDTPDEPKSSFTNTFDNDDPERVEDEKPKQKKLWSFIFGGE